MPHVQMSIDFSYFLHVYVNFQSTCRQCVSHNVNNYLLYPLAAVELGAIKEAPENNENLLRRCVASFVYAKAKENEKSIFIKKFNTPGFKKYLKSYD